MEKAAALSVASLVGNRALVCCPHRSLTPQLCWSPEAEATPACSGRARSATTGRAASTEDTRQLSRGQPRPRDALRQGTGWGEGAAKGARGAPARSPASPVNSAHSSEPRPLASEKPAWAAVLSFSR